MNKYRNGIIILLVSAFIPAIGQWNVNGTKVYYSGGNVGIGTNTPDRQLTLYGTGNAYLNVKASSGVYEVLLGADATAGGILSTMTNHDLSFRAGGNQTFMTIKANGNVGIGMQSPTAKLEVIGNLKTTDRINAGQYIAVDKGGSYRVALNGQADGYIAGRNDAVENMFLITSNGNSYLNGGRLGIATTSPGALLDIKYKDVSTNLYRATDGNGQYRWRVSQTFHMFLTDSAGTDKVKIGQDNSWFLSQNVGIGTTSLTSLLHLSSNSSALQVQSTATSSVSAVNLINDSGFVGLSLASYSSTYPSGSTYARPNGVSLHTTSNAGASAGIALAARNASGYITLHTGGDTERMRVLSNGNVGIGTTSPDSKLTVAGDIHSREVRVTINAGADFVFMEDYDLRTLSEVEAFIQQNKHLPEIESAKEMENNGLELGKMDMKLLQKIEELTLYMISFKKEMEKLQAENEVLRARISSVEKD